MLMTGSQIVLEVLAEEKVDTVFGYPGGTILNVYDALYDNQLGIRHFITAHEQGAAHAADGYARATGKTGVVFATSGPGSTNLVTGIATAYMDSIPMVAITANVPNAQIGSDSFQEVYITGITMPITKHNFVVRRVEDLADTIRQAFSIANSGRPGPVLVDIPKDVTAASCEFLPAPAPAAPERPAEIDPAVIAEVAALINAAERPVIHFGGGVIGSGASPLVYELAHRASIPACHTIMGTGVLSYNDPLNMGMVGMHGNISAGLAINGADLLLVIGARFSDRVATKPSDFARRARIVQIDIDRSEINKNIHIDYSIVGDVGRVLEAVLPLIERKEHPAWQAQIDAWRTDDVVPPASALDGKLHPYDIIHAVAELAGEDELYSEAPNAKQAEYIRALVCGVADHAPELDEFIARYAKGWSFDRIPLVASAIMRVAMYEILYFRDVPNSVAINEAVEIAKNYESPEVVRFINGILGSFVRGELKE